MPTSHHTHITTTDGTRLYYKDWGARQPIVFSHGWPLNGDAWDDQMLFLASHGYRCIAHDRRGHGRSSQRRRGSGQIHRPPWHHPCGEGLCATHKNQVNDDLLAFLRT